MLKVTYNFLIKIFYIPYCFLILLRRFYNKEHKEKFREKIFSNKKSRAPGFLFWFHAASIGELNSIIPIIEFFLKKNIKFKFLITTVTISSFYEFEKKFKGNERIYHQFLPYDSKNLVEKFLNKWKPDIISFVDSEIWPNFFFKIKEYKIPLILLNARITKKTFNRWKIVRNFATEVFNSIEVSISSNKETIDYLNYLKAKNIKFFGNIKFCSSINTETSKKNNNIQFERIVKKEKWCAVSTHPDEELFCANVHKLISKSYKNILTIIIPRHINNINKISSNLKKLGLKVQIKNENDIIDDTVDIVLVNYYGSVKKYLENIKQIFIGKSLLKKLRRVGGQNPIDAAKMGCHIFHGPYVYNFKEIYDYLNIKKISEEVDKPDILAKKLTQNFKDQTNTSRNNKDSLEEHGKYIFENVINEYEKFLK